MSPASAAFSSSSRSIRSISERSRSAAMPPTSAIFVFSCAAPAARPWRRAGGDNRAAMVRPQPARRPSGRASAVLVGGGELVELLARRLGLVARFPALIRHAVDDLARLLVGEVEPALLGGGAIPFRQAVAAEACKVHQVDVLHVGALAEMLHQAAKGRRLQLDAGLVVHGALLRGAIGCSGFNRSWRVVLDVTNGVVG